MAPSSAPLQGAALSDSLARAFRQKQSLLRRYPSRWQTHLELGEIYYRIGNDYGARHHLELFLSTCPPGPDSLRAALLRARSLLRLDRYFEATVALDQVTRRPDAPPGASHDLALLWRRDGLPVEAVMASMRAVEASGGQALFLREAAAQWKELKRLDEALALYARCETTPGAEGEELFQAAYLAHRFGDLEAARRRYESALRLLPEHPEAHYNLGLVLEQAGEDALAASHWREVIHLRPAYEPTYFQLGSLLLRTGQREEAAGVFEEYLKVSNDFMALLEAAGILNSLGVPEERVKSILGGRADVESAARIAAATAEDAAVAADSAAVPAGSAAVPADTSAVPVPQVSR